MNALKTLVIFMAILIVAGIALVGYGLSGGTSRKATVPAPLGENNPASTELRMPSGTRIEQILAVGDHLAIHVTGGIDKILLLDARTGQLTGSVSLVPDAK